MNFKLGESPLKDDNCGGNRHQDNKKTTQW